MKQKLLAGALTLALCLLAACGGGEKTPSSQGKPASETGQPSQSAALQKTAGGVGDTLTGDTWSISLLYAKEYEALPGGYSGETPDEGNRFLALFFEVENISGADDYFNWLNAESYVDDFSVDLEMVMNDPDGFESLSGNVGAGKKLRGYWLWQVPSDWSQLEVSYKNSAFGTGKAATFTVSPQDLSPADYAAPPREAVHPSRDAATPIGGAAQNSGWKIILTDVKQYPEIKGSYSVSKPEAGNVYVVAFLEVENISGEDDYFNPMNVVSYVDGYHHSKTSLLSDVEGQSSASGDVGAGKKLRGYLAWEVPEDWGSLEFIYAESLAGTGDGCEFVLFPDML